MLELLCQHHYNISDCARERKYIVKRNNINQTHSGRVLPAVSGLAIAVFLVAAAVLSYGSSASSDPEIEETVARLEELESRDTAEIENSIPDEAEESLSQEESTPVTEVSVSDIQAAILDGSGVYDTVTLRQKFAGTAIVGDSITESIWEYSYLDQDVVISQRGLSVVNADDQIATTIAMNPKVIFMSFGANDLESYGSNVQGFIDSYKAQLAKLKNALPSVPVYINCIVPLTEGAIAATPDLQYYPQYNEALKAMCDELSLTYIDDSFIVENDSSLYEPDGEHVVSSYYPMWLSYMAEIAGL